MNALKHKPPTIGEGLLIILFLQPVLNLLFGMLKPLWARLLSVLPQGQSEINAFFLSAFLQNIVIIASIVVLIKGVHQLP